MSAVTGPVGEPIAAAEIAQARAAARAARRRTVDVLEESLALQPDGFTARLAATLQLECLPMAELRRAAPAFDLLPFAECSQHSCALLRAADGRLLLAFDDPFSGELQAWAEERIEAAFSWCLVHRGDLVAFLAGHEESLRALDAVQEEVVRGPADSGRIEDLSLKSIGDESSEVVRLVRSTLRDALMIGASDVHLETQPAGLAIKFRIDGILSQVKMIQDVAQAEQAIARVKVLAELDITERRVPQDGRFKALEHGRAVDFRVSIMPSIHGEDAVLRVLDKQSLYETTHQQLSLDSLGFDAGDVRRLRRLSNEPYGMLLVTGPTGSGKTTTLYAAISEINNGQDKIVTIEDPVEYQLPGVLQIPVNEKKGLSFARGLRSILRHDPDKIMVGEIRRPPRVHDRPRQQRVRRHRPLRAHERRPVRLRLRAERHPRAAPGARGLPALRGGRPALGRAAGGIRPGQDRHQGLDIPGRPRLPRVPRRGLQGPQGDRRADDPHRRAARIDHRARPGAAAEGGGAPLRHALPARRGVRGRQERRDHAAGDQPCHVCFLTGC